MSLHQSDNYLGRELPYRAFYLAVLAVIVTCIVFGFILYPVVKGFTGMADARNNQEPMSAELQARPAGPLLQPLPEAQLIDYRNLIDQELEAYGWTDEGAGIARVPVERAKELTLSAGLGPVGAAAATPTPHEEAEVE